MQIWRDAVDATHHFLSPEDRVSIGASVQDFLPGAPLWLAVDDDDRAIAFMGLSDGHIDALFVDPARHGTGVGRAWVDHAVRLHGGELSVDVNEQNEQAIGFYRRLGFLEAARLPTDDQGRPYPLIQMRLTPC